MKYVAELCVVYITLQGFTVYEPYCFMRLEEKEPLESDFFYYGF